MSYFPVDETHDSQRSSWLPSANAADTDFPVQNLPFCVFRRTDADNSRVGVGIGEHVLDLRRVAETEWLSRDLRGALLAQDMTHVWPWSLEQRRRFRREVSQLLTDPQSVLAQATPQADWLPLQSSVELLLPGSVGDYTDFYASIYHATNVGSMLRPDNPLLPNYKHVPIGYHGRASSLIASGVPVRRPVGQLPPAEGTHHPRWGACQNLDYELEIGVWVGQGNDMGTTIPLAEAETHLFGVSLLNDWSARDMQRWEYQPLGPFLAKSFATSLSPWVVTMEALAPYRAPAAVRGPDDPAVLDYLQDSENARAGAIDLQLEVWLQTAQMHRDGQPATRLTCGNFRDMYWTLAQMLTHHASNGCNLRSGDVLGSGTVSGPTRESRGCLLELTWDGEFGAAVPGSQRTPLVLPSGEKRVFLADGDTVILKGYAIRSGFRRIGLGECRGQILGATGVAGH